MRRPAAGSSVLAARRLGRSASREAISQALGSDVDLLIRTGGEKRLSDFLLWESAYAELLFTDRMWPDFDESDLDEALRDFSHRQRRYGGLPGVPSDRVGAAMPV